MLSLGCGIQSSAECYQLIKAMMQTFDEFIFLYNTREDDLNYQDNKDRYIEHAMAMITSIYGAFSDNPFFEFEDQPGPLFFELDRLLKVKDNFNRGVPETIVAAKCFKFISEFNDIISAMSGHQQGGGDKNSFPTLQVDQSLFLRALSHLLLNKAISSKLLFKHM